MVTRAARRAIAAASVAAVLAAGAFVAFRPAVERAVRARLVREAQKLGLSATVGDLHLTPFLSLEVRELVLETDALVRVRARRLVLGPAASFRGVLGRAARVALPEASADLPAGLRLELGASAWIVESRGGGLRVRTAARGEELTVDLGRGPAGRTLHVRARDARLSPLVRILRGGCALVDLGTVGGTGDAEQSPDGFRLRLNGSARDARIASLSAEREEGCPQPPFGAPTAVELEADAVLRPADGSVLAERFRLAAGGISAAGRFAIEGGLADPRVDLTVEVPRVDLGRFLTTAGVERPGDDLGSASLGVRVSGRLLDPATLQVRQRLDFTPPPRPLPAIEKLRASFVHDAFAEDGSTVAIRVSPDSPDFVALGDVPPLFVRTLLLGEDANFYGHPGIDLAELPVAFATDFARGSFARGASTIPQQLAKNLFLSRDKTLGRKLEEAALALLLDSTLGKQRVLEVYLNVIEWGPKVYGLRAAARHYFGREPSALTPKQMAFLVSLIPGPIKYQRSIAGGVPSEFFDGLMATLLTKLHAVGALTDAEYETALREPLDLRSGTATAAADPARHAGFRDPAAVASSLRAAPDLP